MIEDIARKFPGAYAFGWCIRLKTMLHRSIVDHGIAIKGLTLLTHIPSLQSALESR